MFNLPDANKVLVFCDGKEFNDYDIVDTTKISIKTDVRKHNFEIDTGYYLSKEEEQVLN